MPGNPDALPDPPHDPEDIALADIVEDVVRLALPDWLMQWTDGGWHEVEEWADEAADEISGQFLTRLTRRTDPPAPTSDESSPGGCEP